MRATQRDMSVSDKDTMYISSLAGAEEDGNDSENSVELRFAGSKQLRSSAPTRLRIYRCLMF